MNNIRVIQNFNLTDHFTFYEIMEGTAVAAAGHKMMWEDVKECNINKQIELYTRIEKVREWVNCVFLQDNDNIEIGQEVTSGFRSKRYELWKGRSGGSRHLIDACDIRPSNVKNYDLAVKILYATFEHFEPSWPGGIAIMEPDKKNKTRGAIHFDIRPMRARWTY